MLRSLGILVLRIVALVIFLPIRLVLSIFIRTPPGIVNLAMDDAGMKAAMDRARATVPQLLERLANPPAGQVDLSVKVPLPTTSGGVEHVWMGQVRREGDELVGVLGNEPQGVRGYAMGGELRTRIAEISDWMAIDNGVLIAGYTVRYIRQLMTARQREAFDRTVPFRITDEGEGLISAA